LCESLIRAGENLDYKTRSIRHSLQCYFAEEGLGEVKVVKLLRFQFVIAVWGDKFIDQMCEVCLPCVLAPHNLPAIPESERFKFVFVTRAADALRLKAEPMVQRLQDLIQVEFLAFDPTEYASAHLALSAAHRMALAMAAREAAHFVLLDPDLVFSDNTLASARRMAIAGKSAIMVSGLRLTSETALPVLHDMRLSDTYGGNPILAPRNLMKFALQHFHPEVARYRFDSSQFTQWPLICLWPVEDEGLLDRSFHLHPLVLDMRNARPEALSTLDHDTIDGAYVFHAFPDWSKIHVEGDSDNMLVFSFSSMHENIEPPRKRRAGIQALIATAYMFNVNALHRFYFRHAIKLHTGDLNDRWSEIEKSTAHLDRYFRNRSRARSTFQIHRTIYGGFLWVAISLNRATYITVEQLKYKDRMIAVGKRALAGEADAWRRIFRRVGIFSRMITGNTLKGPPDR
jgi:hypothetical protein